MTPEQSILADWARLGIAWNITPSRTTPDVERLIIRSLAAVPGNARLLVLVTSWLSVYWRCVGRDRLLTLARACTPREQATLGIILNTVDTWLSVPAFRAIARALRRVREPEPLFDMDRTRPALAHLAEMEASPISRRWRLWCLPIERKLDAIRPKEWVMRRNPLLKTTALFKGALKSSLLSAIAADASSAASIRQLADACGVTRKAMYDAIDDLRFCGLLDERVISPQRPRGARSL